MSNVGQAIVTIAGAAIGFAFGGPFGAQIGYLIGSGAGSLLFPTELAGIKGPRLSDLTVQTSTIGAPIPIVYGTFGLAGNVIWSAGIREVVTEEEVGGKGAPEQTVTNYTYFASFAAGICEGEIDGIRKIWADTKVIYDLSPQAVDETDEDYAARVAASQQTAELMTVYVGSETQLPDPLIEANTTNVPAFRGLAYVVFDTFPLADYGNRIPNLRFEVYNGTAADVDCTQYSAGNLEPWAFQLDASVFDPRNPDNNHLYRYTEGLGGTPNTDLATAKAQMLAAQGRPFLIGEALGEGIGDNAYIKGWSVSTTPNSIRPCEADPSIEDYVVVQITLNSLHNVENCENMVVGGATVCDALVNAIGECHYIYGDGDAQDAGFFVRVEGQGGFPACFEGHAGDPDGDCVDVGEDDQKYQMRDHELAVSRSLEPPEPCSDGVPLAGAPGYCVVDGVVTRAITWTLTAGTFKVLQAYDTDGGNVVTQYPVDPTLPSTDPDYNSQSFWEAAYADALASGEPIASGLTYGVDYPTVVAAAYVGECTGEEIEAECVLIADIVQDICERAGLTTVDVSGITGTVHGYCVSRVMSARDAIGPLRTVGIFDAVESGEVLKFVERGAAAVATITEDDLCAHPVDSDRPPAVETTRIQEKELPRRVRFHYASQDRNYEPGEQSASRITTEAVTELDVEAAVALCEGDEEAAQLAEILLYEAWVSRSTYRFALDNSWLRLEPTDCLILPVDDQLERVRILSVDYSVGGILQIDAVRDDDGSYVSTAVPSEPEPSGNQGGAGGSVVCPSEIVLLDIPRLRAVDVDAGYYAGVYGLCGTWTCAAVYRSGDGGDNYRRVGSTNTQATIGNVVSFEFDTGGDTSDTSDTSGLVLDYSFTLLVELDHGTLSSTTIAGLISGINTAAMGSHGRWDIFQFLEASLVTGDLWELRGLVRGLRGTEEHSDSVVAGDRFVLLSGPGIFRIPEECSQRNIAKLIKVPSCGESLASVDAENFTTTGESCNTNVISDDEPNDGDVPIFDPDTGEFVPGCLRLEQLCNVEFDSSVQVGEVLAYAGDDSDGPVFEFQPGGGSGTGTGDALALDDLSDVTINSPEEGDVLMYMGTEGWQNQPISAVVGTVVDGYQAGDIQSTTNASLTSTDVSFDLAVGVWFIQLYIRSTSHATPDYNVRYNFSGTATGELLTLGVISSSTAAFGVQHALNNESLAFASTTNNAENILGTLAVTVAGTFTYQFRQSSNSPGNPITVRGGSYGRATKIS